MQIIKKTLSVMISVVMLLSVFTIIPVTTAGALEYCFYLDENGEVQRADSVVILTSDTTELEDRDWYSVTADTEINDRITLSGDVYLILCNGATLTARKGITVTGEDNSLTIWQQPDEENKATGELIVGDDVPGFCAGIGGDEDSPDCSSVTFIGGTVTATGGRYGAGIGGGYKGDGGNITVNGGTVTATGGYLGAGIGGGYGEIGGDNGGNGGNITINGGTVNATGGEFAAGIGGGNGEYSGGNGGNITVNGGTVTATGGYYGAGIGGGYGYGDEEDGNGGDITVTSGTVTATGGKCGAGIGGGGFGHGGTITINGGTVNATGGEFGAGIGGGDCGNGGNISISGGIVTANGSVAGAGIGGGDGGKGGNITVSGGTVTATGDTGMGGFDFGEDICIVTLKWTDFSDSIYSSSYSAMVTLEKDFRADQTFIPAGVLTYNGVIADKTLTPYTDYEYIDENGDAHTTTATPIGNDTTELSDGWYAVTEDREISDRIICDKDVYLILCDGATLTAPEGIAVNENDCLTIYGQAVGDGTLLITGSGSEFNAGIGGDQGCRSGVITINSGTVNVNIDNIQCQAAAIGGGEDGDGSVFINGGTVSATNEGEGAGIGGAYQCSGFVEINGGNVTASSVGGGVRSVENHHISSVRLSWTNMSDSIKADSYIGNVTLLDDFRADSELIPAGGLIDNSVIVGKKLTPPGFIGHSLTLEGDISINYFTYLSDAEIESGAVVDFSWTVNGVEKTWSDTLTAADLTANGYMATCPVAVAEMTYDVTATLTVDGEELATDTYSVKQYADAILSYVYKAKYIAAGYTEEQYDKLEYLIKTMLDYGAKAQTVFKRNTGNLANKDVDYTMAQVTADMIATTPSDMDAGLDAYGLEYAGTTIVYLTKTSMRHYYTITDRTKFDAVKDDITFNGEKVDYKTKDGNIYFELTNIAAADLDTPYTLTIGESSYDHAVLDYVRACINSDDVPRSTFNLVCATYWYSMAANTYFGR